MEYKKKLIEVALPLDAINAEAAREKSIRHGHPSTLHLWWARRPLAAARAVIWASLVDDPSSLPEQFPTEKEQNAERERLFKILSELVKWENSNDKRVLDAAKAEIMRSTGGNPPPLLDPFAGGGAIPLEAQRLGLEAHASDLNPVAVMINKAMIEIPPKFAKQPAVNPIARKYNRKWKGAQGLAEDVKYYGEWMRKKIFERVGHLYPKIKDKGQERTVIAWIWARTVKCPNPACGCEMPLVRSFALSKKKGKEAFVEPILKNGEVSYLVKYGKNNANGTVGRMGARCPFCDTPIDLDYIRAEAKEKRMGANLIAIVAEDTKGRVYISPNTEHVDVSFCPKPDNIPQSDLPEKALGFRIQSYGMTRHQDLFTNRQLTVLSALVELIAESKKLIKEDGGSQEYAEAVAVYLAFNIDRAANFWSSLCGWRSDHEAIRETFARHALPMVWDYAEVNPFSNSVGNFGSFLEKGPNVILELDSEAKKGIVKQQDAQSDNGLRNIMVSTDPPYYDNIAYADLSDFFYVWLRQSLKSVYPDLFHTMLVPKAEELIATPFRFDGNMDLARKFFEDGMLSTFQQVYVYAREDIPVTVYYAFKQSESESDGEVQQTASTGWETMLSAIIRAGFSITGTWPMEMELATRTRGIGSNALSSTIVLVCRKRSTDAPICTRRDFINVLKRDLKPALVKLQASNIAPVDLAQSAIGPGMGVYSRFSKVLEADGTPMTVRSALQIINQELDFYQQDGEIDQDSRFCVEIYTLYAFNEMKFGEADSWARAKNTSVKKLAGLGVLSAQKGVVRLLTREEIPEKVDKDTIWLLTQQLTRAVEKDGIMGVAKILDNIHTSEPERAKALAYRLFAIAERKGLAQEAYAYNSLITAWLDVQSKVSELKSKRSNAKQTTLDGSYNQKE